MTVQRKKPFGNDTESISRQISRAASRLDRHNRTARALGSSLATRIRASLASPAGLWTAGGTGYLLGEWIHRPINEPRPAREQPSKSAQSSQTVAMSNAVLLLKFALDLGILLKKRMPGAPVPEKAAEADPAE